ncbi:MAG: hypothetical protein WC269_02610 [Candidatus Gracilibacteria bacterium]|jgi:hypothetical protein
MKFKPLALGLACGFFWAVGMLLIHYYPVLTSGFQSFPMQGNSMRFMMADLYPFYRLGVWYAPITAVVMGFIDGFLGGLIFGYLYNYLAEKVKK